MKVSAALHGVASVPNALFRMQSKGRTRAKPRHFIKQWRRHRGLTQEQLAERLEMSTSSISQIETGKQGYSEDTLHAIAEALAIDVGSLLVRDPSDPAKIWTVWDNLTPVEKEQAVAVITALKVARG